MKYMKPKLLPFFRRYVEIGLGNKTTGSEFTIKFYYWELLTLLLVGIVILVVVNN